MEAKEAAGRHAMGSGMKWLGLLAGALLLAVVGTWPLGARLRDRVYDPTHLGGVWGEGSSWDIYLTLWILAWDAHALATDPGHILDANIFHPAPRTLALSENLFGVLPLYLPARALTGDPVAAHQAVIVLTFAAAFLAALALVRVWTEVWVAAATAGVLFAFAPFRGSQIGALQTLGDYWLPIVPLAIHRIATTSDRRWSLALGTALVLETLNSYYLGYCAFLVAAVCLAAALPDSSAIARRRLVFTVTIAMVVVALSAIPYLLARREAAIPAAATAVQQFYSATPGRTGATPALVIALLTLPWWRAGMRATAGGRWLAALVACTVLAHLLALGPLVQIGGLTLPGPFAAFAAVVPGVAVIRAPVRFNAVATMGLAALAGIGVAGGLRRCHEWSSSWQVFARGIVVAGAAGAVAYGVPHPVPVKAIETWATLPPAYRWLATAPRGPLVEIPFHDVRQPLEPREEVHRQYLSIWHWQPLVNGYSGFVPASYGAISATARALPAPAAVADLVRDTGLRWVLVHRDQLTRLEHGAWRPPHPRLDVAAVFGRDVLFTVRR